MATKWLTNIKCFCCGQQARVGIEKDGQGSTYRVMCSACGIMAQVGMSYPAGQQIAQAVSAASARVLTPDGGLARGESSPLPQPHHPWTWEDLRRRAQ